MTKKNTRKEKTKQMIRKTKTERYNQHYNIIQRFDIVIEGKHKEQNGFGLRFGKYLYGDIVDLSFFRGNAICLHKKDIEKLIKYFEEVYRQMK